MVTPRAGSLRLGARVFVPCPTTTCADGVEAAVALWLLRPEWSLASRVCGAQTHGCGSHTGCVAGAPKPGFHSPFPSLLSLSPS
eukprot:366130-Chlamydomonas_euryale.AAC.11